MFEISQNLRHRKKQINERLDKKRFLRILYVFLSILKFAIPDEGI